LLWCNGTKSEAKIEQSKKGKETKRVASNYIHYKKGKEKYDANSIKQVTVIDLVVAKTTTLYDELNRRF
jgi:hypothetical protein